MSLPTTIHLFLVDGDPEGIKVISKDNWTGQAVMTPRAALKRALTRPELDKAGVYVLFSKDEITGQFELYVGQADQMNKRLKQHLAKGFWTQLIAFSSMDDRLNRAIISHLEARLIELATQANRWKLHNFQLPQTPNLSEMDRAAADAFLSEMLMIYPVLGVDAFESGGASHDSESVSSSDKGLLLYLRERGAKARARYDEQGVMVLKGSQLRKDMTASAPEAVKRIREELMARGVIGQQDGKLLFLQDYLFSSPSGAASVLTGASINGRTAWKDAHGVPLKDLEKQ
ncbi:protein of unknown function [Sulfurivirga caldicuralii]|uniref:DUF4357 domain-containing protein n=1 Tax=Sulfurivirga caldicuralii TaxID=364032 RepID=A0A1N6DNQ1_9GAMM|nr:GIY-YIG nuclease family protein [Sulfurivirga caldicuralii]SIN72304.1 protein of unknown function [Sulfurivirga caldicuralii]